MRVLAHPIQQFVSFPVAQTPSFESRTVNDKIIGLLDLTLQIMKKHVRDDFKGNDPHKPCFSCQFQ